MIKELFQSKTRTDILVLLFTNHKKHYYIRQLSRLINQQPNAVRMELIRLEKLDLIKSEKEGNMIFYQANEESPIFPELRSIIFKTEGIGNYLKKVLKNEKIKFAFLYGSTGAGKDRKGSDIDLMIIGEPDINSLSNSISKIENKLNREINYSVFSEKDFLSKKNTGFIINVLRNKKLMIIGDKSEFERFIK